ncbi:MAG: CAAX prenyl protease-related protein [Chthonomonas sp.]|nr:CAAX prenyl protease-related protein [Chthonomonas sp.]
MIAKFEGKYPWLPYVLPMALFMGITAVEGKSEANYPLIYIAKVIIVVIALLMCRTALRDIRFDKQWIMPSIALGLVMLGVWVNVEQGIQYSKMGARSAFNPFEKIDDPTLRNVWMAFRFMGLALVVPVMEELFWRSFGLRIATQTDFLKLKIGEFSTTGFGIVVAVFAFSHPEWVPAAIFAAVTGLWVYHTRSIFACIVLHAVTNLGLGLYVVTQHQWKFW